MLINLLNVAVGDVGMRSPSREARAKGGGHGRACSARKIAVSSPTLPSPLDACRSDYEEGQGKI